MLTFILLAMGCLGLRAEQLADSVRVHFRVNEAEIDTLLPGNNQSLQGFLHDLSDPDMRIERILITGAASPEGSIAVNEYLSRRRADAITRWLEEHFEFPDTLPQYVFKGRDWQGLLAMVEQDPEVPHRAEVMQRLRNIIDGTTRRDGVAYLKALRGGVPYRYLWRNHFPALRASEVFIAATVEPIDNVGTHPGASDNAAEEVVELPVDTIPQIVVADTIVDIGGRTGVRPYVFALKTNLLYDAALIPNLGVEFPIGRHFSLGANWMYAWWHNHAKNRHWRIYGGDINARWYFGRTHQGASLQGHHVGVYGQVLVFQVANGGKGYITGIPGENLWGKPWVGGGIEYGYSKRIGKRLNLDFTLGLGYIGGEYREYRPIDGHYVWQSSHRRNWFGPTKAEISLVWIIGKEVRR